MGATTKLGITQIEEAAVQHHAERLLQQLRQTPQRQLSLGEEWLNSLIRRLMTQESLRVRALRFADVVPALSDDAQLADHLQQYFLPDEIPLPKLARWGIRYSDSWLGSKFAARAVRVGMRLLATRFMGGSSVDEISISMERLRAKGCNASLDLLGEATLSEQEADSYLQAYLQLLQQLPEQTTGWPKSTTLDFANGRTSPQINLSIKVSSLYSQIKAQDPAGSVAGIAPRLRKLLLAARNAGAAVCIDMEHYDYKETILKLFTQLMMEEELRDWPDVGIAIQAYLKDVTEDLPHLIDWAAKRGTPITVRLVRGAYWDQESVIAQQMGWHPPVWEQKFETDAAYEWGLEQLFANHPVVETAVATHNLRSIAVAMAAAERFTLASDQFEFQMLYGMSSHLRDAIVSQEHRLRVYLPFGELLPGMAYLVRRLLENSSSQAFITEAYFDEVDQSLLLRPPEPQSAQVAAATEGDKQQNRCFTNAPARRFTSADERNLQQTAIANIETKLGRDYPALIGIDRIATGNWIISCDPGNSDRTVGRVAAIGAEHADRAIAVAEQEQPRWAKLSQAQRAEHLRQIAHKLEQRRAEFAAWEMFEAGKPWREADADVTEAIDFLNFYAAEAERLSDGWRNQVPGEMNHYLYRPRGIGVVIPPWNFPLAILVGMSAGALVMGNAVLLKPSSETPVVAYHFVQLARETGLPAGVLQYLPGPGAELGEYLVTHPRTHFIAFTGSQEVGLRINSLAAEVQDGQHHVKHVVAEMGGKNALIIDSDAHLDDAVAGTLVSAFGYQGQKCSAASRVVVVGSAYEPFLSRLVEAARSMVIGPAQDPASFVGPVISVGAKERIEAVVATAESYGRVILCGEGSAAGCYLTPTIVADVDPQSSLAQEEIFGPVLAVMAAASFTEALAIANNTRYALTGGIFSRNPRHLQLAQEQFDVGNLYLNRNITGALVGRQPFGGHRLSGIGLKAGGPDYLLQFAVTRTTTSHLLRRGFAPTDELVEELWQF